MSTIVTRAGKGSELTWNEVDANFNNLNSDKIQSGNTVSALTITTATINGGTITASTGVIGNSNNKIDVNGTNISQTIDSNNGAFNWYDKDGVNAPTNLMALDLFNGLNVYTSVISSSLIKASAGTVGNAAFGASTDTNTGMFFPAADNVAFTTGGTERMRINSTGVVNIPNLSASSAVATDASDNLISVTNTGTGNNVLATSPTLVTPVLGTPTSGTLTNCTGLPIGGITATGTPSASTYLRGDSTWATVSAGMTYPSGTGIAVVSGGTAWGTTLTAPSGAIVGTTDTQTLTNKTLTSPAMIGTLVEDVFTITDAAGFAIDPDNGSIQLITLGASRTPTVANFSEGEAVTLMINDGTAFTITWTTIGVVWVGGVAPTLATTGFTVIELWRVGSTYYGAYVGTVA